VTDSTGWTELAELWQRLPADTPTPGEPRASVERDTRRLRRIVWCEVGVVVVTGLWLARGLQSLPSSERAWWLAAAVIHVAVVVGFATWNRSGVFAPLGESTRDYLALARLRLTRSLRSARFVVGMIAAESLALVFGLARRPGGLDPMVAASAALAMVVTLAGALWYRARVRRQLERLAPLTRRYGLAGEGSLPD